MELQDIRKTFKEANIITAKNGIAVSYPPRSSQEFRNRDSVIHGNQTLYNLLKQSKEARIVVGKDGFLLEFSYDGNSIENGKKLPSYSEPVTWEMVKTNTPARNDIAEYRFDKYFNGADVNDISDLMGRLAGFLSEIDTEEEQMTYDENVRWEMLKKNFKAFHRYFPEIDYEDGMRVLEVFFCADEYESFAMTGLPLTIFTEMVKASTEIDIHYSCGNDGAFASFMFVV